LDIHDNTDDAEPQMIQNAQAMVEEHQRDVKRNQLGITLQNSKNSKLNSFNNDPDLNNRQKMWISFDPFESGVGPVFSGTISPEVRMKGANNPNHNLKTTFESKQLRNLESPKSVQSNPQRIPE